VALVRPPGKVAQEVSSEEGKGKGEAKSKGKAKAKNKTGAGGQLAFEAVRTETHKFVEYDNGEVELYDLEADPYELESIHESADPTLVEDLKTKLEDLKSCSEEACREAENTP
jgi:hypothetical protein